MSKTKQAPGQGKKYIKKSQMKRIQKVSPSRKVQHKCRLKRALTPKVTRNANKSCPQQNGINIYEKEQYKPEVAPPIAIGDGILVLWDDQSEGVCHYMPRSDLKVLGRCNKFYPGSRIVYSHDGTEWTGRIPKSVNEVIECCCMQDAAVDLRTHPKRQVLVLWDNPSAGLCHYMYTKDLRIVDDSYRIYRGTRVAIRWKHFTLTGQVPPEIYDSKDFPILSQSTSAVSDVKDKQSSEANDASECKPEEYHIKIIDDFWDCVNQFCRDINDDDIKFFENRIEKYRASKPITISSLTYNSPKSKCESEPGDAAFDKKAQVPDSVASAPVSRRSSVHCSVSPEAEIPCPNGNEVDVAALAAAVNQHAVTGAGDGVREMDTDLPSESSTSVDVESGLVDGSAKGSVSSSLSVEIPEDPLDRLRRRRGSTASDEELVRSRASASFAHRRRAATVSDRRLMSSKAMFQKRLNSARKKLKIDCAKEESMTPEFISSRLQGKGCDELASAAAAIVARYQRRFPFCPWNELADSMLSDDENEKSDEMSEDEVMDTIMQKQAELRAVEDRNRTTFEVLVERMKESMERQEILKRVTQANEKVTEISSNIVKLLKLKYRSKGRTRRNFVKLREAAWVALTEREVVMEELKTFDLAHGTKFIFKND